MISWKFTYKGKEYGVTVQEEPTEEIIRLLMQNALETLNEALANERV